MHDDFNEGAMFGAVPPGAPMAPFMPPPQMPERGAQMNPHRHRDVPNPHENPVMSPAAAVASAQSPMPPPTGMPNGNPLARYFRAPGLNVALPSGGAFLPKGAIELTAAGDVPVFPMVAADELLLKSPDALMSGYALERLLLSCVPAIKTPRLISTPDLDVLLLAIRAATLGDKMTITSTCPKCSTEGEFECSLPAILGTMKTMPRENPVHLAEGIVAFVRPFTMHHATVLALASFEEARRLQALDEGNPDATTRAREAARAMERINRINLDAVTDCVERVSVPDGVVTDRQQIAEFMANVSKTWVQQIDRAISRLGDTGIDKTIHLTCGNPACEHEWTTEVEFDPSNFFDGDSSK